MNFQQLRSVRETVRQGFNLTEVAKGGSRTEFACHRSQALIGCRCSSHHCLRMVQRVNIGDGFISQLIGLRL